MKTKRRTGKLIRRYFCICFASGKRVANKRRKHPNVTHMIVWRIAECDVYGTKQAIKQGSDMVPTFYAVVTKIDKKRSAVKC